MKFRSVSWLFLFLAVIQVAVFVIGEHRNSHIKDQEKGFEEPQVLTPNNLRLGNDQQQQHNVALPNILLIGAQNSGTTAIAEWLFEHGGVCRPQVFDGEMPAYHKGVQFFDQKDRYEGGLEFYSSRYQHCGKSQFQMDATPNYLTCPERVETIYRQAGGDHLKNLKVIVMLREPVSRELSLYNHKVYEYLKTKAKDQWYSDVAEGEDGTLLHFSSHANNVLFGLENGDEWGIADTGAYARHLTKWFQFVDRKNLLAVSYDEFRADPRTVEGRIRHFLGLQDLPQTTSEVNVIRYKERLDAPSCVAQDQLNAAFEPMNQALDELLNSNPGPDAQQKPFPKFHPLPCTNTQGPLVLPNILLVGAQKAGTTAMSNWLYGNGVCRPARFGNEPFFFDKEVQFFDQQSRYEQGLDFYAKRYDHCRGKAFAMDATPNYLPYPGHVETIYKQAGNEHLKNLKVIAVLREPIAKQLSLYNHKVYEYLHTHDQNQWYSDVSKKDGSVRSFHEYTDIIIRDLQNNPEEWELSNEGQYVLHVKKWVQFVDRKNLLMISYDELKHNPRQVEQRIKGFLGFDFPGAIESWNSKEHGKKVKHPECESVTRLNPYFESMNQELYRFLEEHPGPDSEQKPFQTFVADKECTGGDQSRGINQAMS